MMVIGLIFAVLFALCAIYFGFGMAVIMIYETFFWASEKGEDLYDFVVEKWFWWM